MFEQVSLGLSCFGGCISLIGGRECEGVIIEWDGLSTIAELICTRLLEPLAILQGMMGLRTWLSEVQYMLTMIKQRSFQGMPL